METRALFPALLGAATLFAGTAPAQILPRDVMLVAGSADFFGANKGKGGGLWLLSADRKSLVKVRDRTTPGFTDVKWSNCVQVDSATGLVYVGTLSKETSGAGNIYQLRVLPTNPPAIIGWKKLTATAPDSGSISGITLLGTQVWYATDGAAITRGAIGFVPKAGGSPKNVLVMKKPAINGLGQSITTNGREIFVGTSVASADRFNLWSMDPKAKTPALTGIVKLASTPGQLTLAAGGKVFAGDFRGNLYLVDPVARQATLLNPNNPAPQRSANGSTANPWTGIAVVVPGFSSRTQREVHSYKMPSGPWSQSPGHGTIGLPGFGTGVASQHFRPFEHYGAGCAGVNKVEPRVGTENLARIPSTTFKTLLRGADKSAPAIFALGISKQSLDLTGAGAPGCTLLLAPLLFLATATDAGGKASLPIPIPRDAGLDKAALVFQWILVTPANALRLVLSDGGRFRIR